MKHLNLFIALALLTCGCPISGSGQSQDLNPVQPGPVYVMPSTSAGTIFLLHPGRVFSTQSPYYSTSASTGVTTAHNFSASTGSFYPLPVLTDLIHLAIVNHDKYYEFGIGLNGDMGGSSNGYLKLGYGRIFPFGRWLVQPTMEVYFAFDAYHLGDIDNKDSTISVMGFTANPQFTVTSSDGNGGTETDTYNAGNLTIDYKRNSVLAAPKILLGTILWRRLYVGIEAGWMQQICQGNLVKLTQQDENDDANTNVVGKIHMRPNGSLTGPEVALNIGWCFTNKPGKKKKSILPGIASQGPQGY